MKHLLIKAFSILACTFAFISTAHAQATRTWVSGVGDDANPCSRTAPCKTFAGAISKTATKGEINALDPGGFGAVTITKAITIDGGGFVAGVLTNAANAINVSAGATDVVVLRGLDINGLDTATNGVRYNSGKQLIIENSKIYGFSGDGVSVNLSGTGRLVITNSTISANGAGVRVKTAAGVVIASIVDSVITNNTSGIVAESGTTNVLSSMLTNNPGAALLAQGVGVLNAGSNMVSNNGTGAQSQAGCIIRLSDNDFYNNGVGWAGAGVLASAGNNRLDGNGSTSGPSGAVNVQ